jgi:hypothetical protein
VFVGVGKSAAMADRQQTVTVASRAEAARLTRGIEDA